ncbi:MAG: glycerophosphodiester phosphodiesterase [Acidimicrobiales bacterium]|nr:MAG: glycerophosphodiester phosphodiesterase [Acidimicrobiales bacterium]
MTERPLVIAHRGASALAPEHTLAAYQQALEDGADGWECDVRMTQDGHLVCVHDRRVHRVSNGRGSVARRELEELQRLDFVSWKAGWSPPAQPGVNDGVLTLRRLLEFFVDCDTPLRLLIETKHPSRFRGEVERALVALLQHFDLHHPSDTQTSSVMVMSKSPQAIRRVRLLAPSLSTVQLFVAIPPREHFHSTATGTAAVPIVGPWLGALRHRPEYVARAHQAGKKVFVWTVDKPTDVAQLAALGVDAVITNHPRQVREQLDRLANA